MGQWVEEDKDHEESQNKWQWIIACCHIFPTHIKWGDPPLQSSLKCHRSVHSKLGSNDIIIIIIATVTTSISGAFEQFLLSVELHGLQDRTTDRLRMDGTI